MSLAIRNVAFTFVVPGTGAVAIPWWILRRHPDSPAAWLALTPIALGVALYLWCVWVFATVGRGTPGPWDAPRHLVAVGPYRWVRNPIYLGALGVILGEAWLFTSVPLLVYAGVAAIVCHLFVVGYEERTLRRRFGDDYARYLEAVPRWMPHPPRGGTEEDPWGRERIDPPTRAAEMRRLSPGPDRVSHTDRSMS